MQKPIQFTVLAHHLAVCRLSPQAPLPIQVIGGDFFCAMRTADELSLVCPEDVIQPGWQVDSGWRALMLLGPLDLGMVGVMAHVSTALAQAHVNLLALSTYDTDYILVKETLLEKAVSALQAQGFILVD